MLILTHHGTRLGLDASNQFFSSDDAGVDSARISDLNSLKELLGASVSVENVGESWVHFSKDGKYLCVEPDGVASFSRDVAGVWETFRLVPDAHAATPEVGEVARFSARVDSLIKSGEPVRIQAACGLYPEPEFLNVDWSLCDPKFMASHAEQYFIFPTVGCNFPLADSSVDYLFHEDFIEHIDQIGQVQFLAEVLRILKPGGVHRINTPDFMWSMKKYSDFGRGGEGVYTGERQWEHIGMLTKSHLTELALMTGYREVRFNGPGQSVSPWAIPDKRPFGDRSDVDANIFADLIK